MSADKIENNLKRVLETSAPPILIINQALEILDSNAEFNALVATCPASFVDLLDPSKAATITKEIQICFSQPDSTAVFVTSFQNKKQVNIWIEWRAQSDANTCLLVGTDITRYYRSIEELHNQRQRFEDKKKSEDLFVAKMNHELRTPLNAIIGYSQILLRSGLNETDTDHAQRIRHNGKNLLRQIDNVLSIADAESELNIEKVDLIPLLESIIDEFEFSLSERELKVTLKDRRLQDPIDADYSRLRHVIGNLLDNAIKFSNGGEIKLVVQSDEQEVIALHIIDEGVGVSDENLDCIFAPFQKGALLVNDCGIGLGLSAARKLCSTMGFELNLNPTIEGSKFTILFKK